MKKRSGRKRGPRPTGKINVVLRLLPDTNLLLDEASHKAGLSRSEYVDRAIRAMVRLDRFENQQNEP